MVWRRLHQRWREDHVTTREKEKNKKKLKKIALEEWRVFKRRSQEEAGRQADRRVSPPKSYRSSGDETSTTFWKYSNPKKKEKKKEKTRRKRRNRIIKRAKKEVKRRRHKKEKIRERRERRSREDEEKEKRRSANMLWSSEFVVGSHLAARWGGRGRTVSYRACPPSTAASASRIDSPWTQSTCLHKPKKEEEKEERRRNKSRQDKSAKHGAS
jgi:hypothetical protein